MKWLWLLLPLLFLLAPSARAVNVPLSVNHCFVQSSFSSATTNCNMVNTTAGDVIVAGISGASNSAGTGVTTLTITATEAFTCPAGAVNDTSFAGISTVTKLCYVVTASSHATFNTTLTVTSGAPAPTAYTLGVEEWQGLGAIDGAASANAATFSVSVTTANTNEIILEYCSGRDTDITAGAGFSQQMGFGDSDTLTGAQDPRGFHGSAIFASTGAHTASCTGNNPLGPRDQIVALAFQQSSPPATPASRVIQECGMNSAPSGGSPGGCTLSNTVAGNKVVLAAINGGMITANFANFAVAATETMTCVSNTFVSHNYGGADYSGLFCYVDTVSSHGTFPVKLSYTGCPGCIAMEFFVYELSGTVPGIDAGSATTCAATTCNYTTATNNEPTLYIAGDTMTGGMVPGNSFAGVSDTFQNFTGAMTQGSVGFKNTVSSGVNTASFSGAATPMMAVLAFGPSTASAKANPFIF